MTDTVQTNMVTTMVNNAKYVIPSIYPIPTNVKAIYQKSICCEKIYQNPQTCRQHYM